VIILRGIQALQLLVYSTQKHPGTQTASGCRWAAFIHFMGSKVPVYKCANICTKAHFCWVKHLKICVHKYALKSNENRGNSTMSLNFNTCSNDSLTINALLRPGLGAYI